MADYPRQIAGRVSNETGELIDKAEQIFGVKEGTLVRMAMDDYMPRYLANQGRPQHAELFAQLAMALQEKPEVENELKQIARRSTRRIRAATAA